MSNRVIDEIDKLLLTKWDPIGVGHTSGVEDEYSQYASEIYRIIKNSISYENLFEYLWELETQYMGLKGNRVKTDSFAQMLFNQIQKLIKPQSDGKFHITIGSFFDREDLVAEISYEGVLWAEISQETEEMRIQFYSHPTQQCWEFPADEALETLDRARKKLVSMGRLIPLYAEDESRLMCIHCCESWECTSKDEKVMCPKCKKMYPNPRFTGPNQES